MERLQLGHAILEAEVAVPDAAGVTHISYLHNSMRTGRGQLVFYAFDLLWLGRSEMRNLPLIERKVRLNEVLHGVEPPIVVSSYLVGHGPVIMDELCPRAPRVSSRSGRAACTAAAGHLTGSKLNALS